jgi:hypothetical protein
MLKLSSLVLILICTAVVFQAGCSLLNQPEEILIPPTSTPVQTPVSALDELEPVTDPTSLVIPSADPDILALTNAVSDQQLLGYVQTLEGFGTRNTFSTVNDDEFGIGAASAWIFEELQRVGGGALSVEFDEFQADIDGLVTNQRNIVATLPGTGNHEGKIVISAHYDSRGVDPIDGSSPSPGANDNGSGVALLLEMARLLSSRQWNQTIVFAVFAAEEQGTYGSRHFVQEQMLGGEHIDAVLNNDIVGGRPGIPQSVRVFSPGPDTHNSRQLARYLDLVGGLYLPTFRVDLIDSLDREDRYGDHREFIDAGIAAVRLTESEEDLEFQHSSLDTSDRIEYAYLRQVVQLNLATVANLAGAPPPPEIPTVAPMGSPGSYLVTWLPDPRAEGYAISFRPINSSDYPPFRYIAAADAGNVALTELDPEMTFAVSLAAIDSNGRISGFSPEVLTQSVQ